MKDLLKVFFWSTIDVFLVIFSVVVGICFYVGYPITISAPSFFSASLVVSVYVGLLFTLVTILCVLDENYYGSTTESRKSARTFIRGMGDELRPWYFWPRFFKRIW